MWNVLAILGEEAWWTFGNRGPRTVLTVISATKPAPANKFFGIDVSTNRSELPILLEEKVARLADKSTEIKFAKQADQLLHPRHVIIMGDIGLTEPLGKHAMICEGSSRGDIERFDRFFWELREFTECGWELIVSSAVENEIYGGRDTVFLWDNGKSECTNSEGARIRGNGAWGRQGIFLSRTHMNCQLTLGTIHAQNGVAIHPS